ncbi:toll/interleukin-1 receptor domain-containing protein [Aeromonas caviae]|uniref:Toll/interleukin-1 receptor domain-containing protein n=1 Tax=Aeromonas caviae TaxID=648 RepID=A0AAF0GCW6_AERCA|nr:MULTISPECIES: toll/interleukin-1 receptor domain-containing protein [Aeromonas]MCU7792415.1 toll/interleukin-1 receptor domain-containing protein [Aeromonas caviae]WAF60861.1 toll/interleukin-1 receptor domain-containing protein [Aeromonas caviae]WAF64921.1 toll/interleukin-1 receptor domain-containing protein [Aeromonas caviae]WAF81748.1 toll/interleukin-1 receptor domain-containing protein [Aeromonas caviae]WGC85891.1 toll/interleukin-1 receptor domain-containing protein [Aeromonas caviae
MDIEELKKRAWDYVQRQADTTVTSVDFVESFRLLGRDDAVISVVTTDKETPEWWVVGGDTPINLYDKSKFNSPDEAFSFHTGIMMRMMDRDYVESDEPPEEIGYDAFISHASEDKDDFVRPLAGILKEYGFRIWYDEFELEIGDSLRESIDKGLVTSRYGIVVLSPKFLDKNWTKYELNSLVAREIEGKKVILPIWHNVTRQQVMQYSPMLADKLALSSENMAINEIAKKVCRALAK